jgi:hypothetical protein
MRGFVMVTAHRTAVVHSHSPYRGKRKGAKKRRLLMVVVALGMPVAATFAITGTAVAASGVSCSSLTGKVNTTTLAATGTEKGCTDTANTGGSGKFSGSESSTTATTKWASGGTTTFSGIAYTAVSPNACPSPEIEYEITGTVASDTGKASSIKKGWTLQVYICINTSTFKFSLLPGTKVEIGKKY